MPDKIRKIIKIHPILGIFFWSTSDPTNSFGKSNLRGKIKIIWNISWQFIMAMIHIDNPELLDILP